MILAHHDADGNILGFYDPEIHSTVPSPSAEITDADRLAHAAGQTKMVTLSGQIADLVLSPAALLANAKARAVSGMVAWIGALLAGLTAGYPPEEVASWPIKSAAARLHLSGTPQEMISIEAQITGEKPDDLAKAILARAEKTDAIMATVSGLRRNTSAAVAAAKTPQEVAEVLAAAQKTALTMAAQMGLPNPEQTGA